MPTFRVTEPNSGRTIRLTGDSPPTQQELEQIFSQFEVQQEPTIDPNILARAPEFQRQQLAARQAEETGSLEALAVGAGRGLTTVGRGLGLAEPEAPAATRAFEALQERRPITTTVGEIAGEAAPFLVPGTGIGAATTLGGRAVLSGLLGATEAGVLARGKGAGKETVVGAAGIGGAVASTAELALPVIGRIGGRLIRRVLGKEPTTTILDAAGNPSAELTEALNKAGIGFEDLSAEAQRLLSAEDVVDPAARARQLFLEEQGLTGTRAQITGEAAEFQAQQELAKTSGRVRTALEAQEQVLAGRFENAISATGGSANRSNSTAFDHIADRSIDLDAAISQAYKTAREVASDQKVIKANNLAKELRNLAPFNEQTGGLASSVKGILQQRGVLDKKFKATGRIDANTAEQIRIDINGLFDSTNPLGRQKIRSLKNALDDDVAEAVGEDVFQGARAAKAKFEKDLRRAKVNKFDRRKKDLVRDILENKVNPDRFLDEAVLSRSVRGADLNDLKTFLNLDGPGPGLDAWNDLRAEALNDIKNKAFKEVAGEAALSRAGLQSALDKIGTQKLKVLFEPKELKFLSDMLKVSKIREPKRGTALGRGPSAQAIGRLEEVLKRIPLIGNVFEGIGVAADGRIALRPPSLQAPLQPTQAARAIPLALPAIPAAIAAQEQQ